jgi:uncharacterized membrane protein
MRNKKVLYSTKWIAYTAMLTALVVATQFIPPIPTPIGRVYWVDGVVLLAAYLMDPLSAFIVGGVGTLIYDILYSPSMMLTSLITHGLQGAVVSIFIHYVFPKKHEFVWALISSLLGAVVVILGYFTHRAITSGVEYALSQIPRNVIQEVIGISIAMVICYATTFKQQLEKSHLLPDFKREVVGDKKPDNKQATQTV